MRITENPQRHQETLPSKEELFDINFGILTISGRSGTGKTDTMNRLANKLGIPQDRVLKVGSKMREKVLAERGEEIIGKVERDLEDDRMLDDEQVRLISTATPENPLLLEARLGGFHVTQLRKAAEEQGTEQPNAVTILLTAESNERFKRIFRRQKKKKPDLIYDRVEDETKRREKHDLKQWRKLHPALENIDPFHPHNKDGFGKPMYDIHIDTNDISPAEVTDKIIEELLARGAISPRNEQLQVEEQKQNNGGDLPQSNVIYP